MGVSDPNSSRGSSATGLAFSSLSRGGRPRRLGAPKLIFFLFLLAVLIIGILEVLAWIGIFMLPAHRQARRTADVYEEQSSMTRTLLDPTIPHHLELHPVLGWRYAAHFRSKDTQMNSRALRSSREYAPLPPPNVLRIAAFGDSFVYGSEVDNANAWPSLMESKHTDMQVLNYGVGGYGVDQAYLRYLLEGRDLSPHLVLIGFSPDDINRTVNVYRRFLMDQDSPLFKPRYVLTSDGRLSLLEVPVRREDYQGMLNQPSSVKQFAQHDYWYPRCMYENPLYEWLASVRLGCTLAVWTYRRHLDPDRPIDGGSFNATSTAFKIQAALFRQFSESVRESGALPLVLMLPDHQSVERVRAGEPAIYEPLLVYMREHGIEYVDGAAAFRRAEPDPALGTTGWFAAQGHYSPSGNQLVAAWLAKMIRLIASR